MEVRATLSPDNQGTRRLVEHSGDQLVCIRYRYDRQRQKRFTTAEIIISESDWTPGVHTPKDRLVSLHIGFGKQELREKVKQAGAYWDTTNKVWRLSYHDTLRFGLENRIDDGIGI